MQLSPKKPDVLRETEARVRALTREVGTLREDLRREIKRRERAVAQAKEHEDTRQKADNKLQELSYANRKLAAELDTAHEAARAAADRDRRALRSLREGLAEVEKAVANRAAAGHHLVKQAFEHLNRLRGLLLTPPHADNLAPGVASKVTHTLADAIKTLSQLNGLLTGATQSVGADEQSMPAAAADLTTASWSQDRLGAVSNSLPGHLSDLPAIDVEKEQLRDEVHRLQCELRTLSERQAGTAVMQHSSALLEMQSLLASSQAQLADLKGQEARVHGEAAQLRHESSQLKMQVAQLSSELQQGAQEQQALRADVHQLQQRLVQQDKARGQDVEAVSQLHNFNISLDQQVRQLQQEGFVLRSQLEEKERQLAEQSSKLAALQGTISAQQADIHNAINLIATSHKHVSQAARPPALSTALALAGTTTTLPIPSHLPTASHSMRPSAPLAPPLSSLVPFTSVPTGYTSLLATHLPTTGSTGHTLQAMSAPGTLGSALLPLSQVTRPHSADPLAATTNRPAPAHAPQYRSAPGASGAPMGLATALQQALMQQGNASLHGSLGHPGLAAGAGPLGLPHQGGSLRGSIQLPQRPPWSVPGTYTGMYDGAATTRPDSHPHELTHQTVAGAIAAVLSKQSLPTTASTLPQHPGPGLPSHDFQPASSGSVMHQVATAPAASQPGATVTIPTKVSASGVDRPRSRLAHSSSPDHHLYSRRIDGMGRQHQQGSRTAGGMFEASAALRFSHTAVSGRQAQGSPRPNFAPSGSSSTISSSSTSTSSSSGTLASSPGGTTTQLVDITNRGSPGSARHALSLSKAARHTSFGTSTQALQSIPDPGRIHRLKEDMKLLDEEMAQLDAQLSAATK